MGDPTNESKLTAVEKTLVVLEAAIDRPRFSDIVARSGMAKSTVHRILATLMERGFVVATDGGEYLPGPRFLSLTGLAFDEGDVSTLLEPLAADLAGEVRCAVHVGMRSGDEMVYLVRADSDKPYRMPSRVGAAIPMHCSGMGKVVLSQLSDGEVEQYVSRTGLPQRTVRTLTTLEALQGELAEIRRTGLAFDREENVPGVVCIAAAVTDYTGRSTYGLSISSLALNHSEADLLALADQLRATAAAMSDVLGGRAVPTA